MELIKENFDLTIKYIKMFIKWILISTVVGVICGLVGTGFHICLDYVTEVRTHNTYFIYFLPIAALIIVAMYTHFKVKGNIDTNRVIKSVRKDGDIPFVMVPLIFISTAITHLFGGSSGREGAALQIGGGIGYNLGKILKLEKYDIRIITMSGMSAVFSALFGTPVAAAVFSLEVISVGTLNFTGFLACIIASVVSFYISALLGVMPVNFNSVVIEALSLEIALKVIVLAVLCAIVSILFCMSLKHGKIYLKKLIKNRYLRGFAGGCAIILLTLLCQTYDYNGAGMHVIEKALLGDARFYDFILKIIFTTITLASGFKGGEIVPTLFIGATFGCVMGAVLGMDASFGAAIGLISLFCGVVNCPITSIILSVELFGADGIILFALACGVSYIMSGNFSLYKSQKIVYSKITASKNE